MYYCLQLRGQIQQSEGRGCIVPGQDGDEIVLELCAAPGEAAALELQAEMFDG